MMYQDNGATQAWRPNMGKKGLGYKRLKTSEQAKLDKMY